MHFISYALSDNNKATSAARNHLIYFTFLTVQILHATELEFLENLNGAKDLDQVITIHNNFVATIYERCLLHHKVSLLKEAIMKVLNMTLTFQQWWDQGVAAMK